MGEINVSELYAAVLESDEPLIAQFTGDDNKTTGIVGMDRIGGKDANGITRLKGSQWLQNA
jgi:hypothetical protein